MNKEYREPTERELNILNRFLSLDFPGNEALRDQMKEISVRTTVEDNDNYGSIEIIANGPPAQTTQRVPVEARAYDDDNTPIDALLHISEGKLSELEFLKVDGTPIKNFPEPEDFRYKVR